MTMKAGYKRVRVHDYVELGQRDENLTLTFKSKSQAHSANAF